MAVETLAAGPAGATAGAVIALPVQPSEVDLGRAFVARLEDYLRTPPADPAPAWEVEFREYGAALLEALNTSWTFYDGKDLSDPAARRKEEEAFTDVVHAEDEALDDFFSTPTPSLAAARVKFTGLWWQAGLGHQWFEEWAGQLLADMDAIPG
jgi:hypothetical protein